ncbi:MAG: hypothetical protein MI784_10320 [Cytophagales bacterium]|nr:hypothetical protein [Cytophagales bacterium]
MLSFKKYIAPALLALLSCNEPEDALVKNFETVSGSFSSGVYILNEGNFDWGTGSVSFFNPKKTYRENDGFLHSESKVFEQINKSEIGNVVQSMTVFNGKGYIVVNNSESVKVVQPETMKWLGTIKMPEGSPRHLLPIHSGKAYLTELYKNCIYVIDLKKNEISKKIPVSGWTDKLLLFENHAYITKRRSTFDKRKGGGMMLKIDTRTDEVVDSVSLPKGPCSLQIDQMRKLWVLCDGGFKDTPALVRINPYTMKTEKKMLFENQAGLAPSDLEINASKDTLYFLNGGVSRHPIHADKLSGNFIPRKRMFYGLDIHPKTGELYVADALDFMQRGVAYRFSKKGKPLDSMRVGVIPCQFVFMEQ